MTFHKKSDNISSFSALSIAAISAGQTLTHTHTHTQLLAACFLQNHLISQQSINKGKLGFKQHNSNAGFIAQNCSNCYEMNIVELKLNKMF